MHVIIVTVSQDFLIYSVQFLGTFITIIESVLKSEYSHHLAQSLVVKEQAQQYDAAYQ